MDEFGEIAEEAHVATGLGRDFVLTEHDGTLPRTYANCHSNEDRDRRFTGLDSYETAIVSKVFIPRLAGAVKPVAGEWGELSAAPPNFPDAGPQFLIADVEETAGLWEVTS